jgi:hypothetical protein
VKERLCACGTYQESKNYYSKAQKRFADGTDRHKIGAELTLAQRFWAWPEAAKQT